MGYWKFGDLTPPRGIVPLDGVFAPRGSIRVKDDVLCVQLSKGCNRPVLK